MEESAKKMVQEKDAFQEQTNKLKEEIGTRIHNEKNLSNQKQKLEDDVMELQNYVEDKVFCKHLNFYKLGIL